MDNATHIHPTYGPCTVQWVEGFAWAPNAMIRTANGTAIVPASSLMEIVR